MDKSIVLKKYSEFYEEIEKSETLHETEKSIILFLLDTIRENFLEESFP